MAYKAELKTFDQQFLSDLGIENKKYYITSIRNIILTILHVNNTYYFKIDKNNKLFNHFTVKCNYDVKYVTNKDINNLIQSKIN